MNMKKIKNLMFVALLLLGFSAIPVHARVLLEDFTHEIRELRPCPNAIGIANPQVKDGALCFDYSSLPQDGTVYGNYYYQAWVNAEQTLYVDFTFNRNVVANTSVTVAMRNYDTHPGESTPFYLDGNTLTLGYNSPSPKTITYPQTSGRAAFYAQDEETGCRITVYLDGVETHTYLATGFFLKASPNNFETRFQNTAKQNAGDTAPVISFDNIKILQDEPTPQSLYVADAELHYDFENSGTFFMSESVFPFYKVKSVRQVANFGNSPITFENILTQCCEEDGYTMQTVSVSPGEILLAELTEDAAHLDDVHTVESYVWNNRAQLSPLVKKAISDPTPARADRPEVLAQKLAQVGNTHPRLLVTQADLSNTTEYLHTDSTFADMYNALVDWRNTYDSGGYMSGSIPAHGDRMGPVCDMIYSRATVWGYLYRITREEQYAQDLMRDMLTIAGYSDWYDPVSYPGGLFLHTAHIARSMAIGYDMIYDYLSKTENVAAKQTIERAIYEKAVLKFIDFHRKDEEDGWQRRTENWNMLCNSGVGTACLAIGNLPEYQENCSIALNYALRSLRYSAGYFNPEGGWTEGPNYYGYMMDHGIDFFASLINTFGDDYGYRDFAGMNASAADPLILAGSKYAYAYSDTPAIIGKNSAIMTYFAKYLDRPELGYFRRDWFNKALAQVESGNAAKSTLNGAYSVKDLLWYDPSFKNTPENAGKPGYDDTFGLPLDYCYRGLGMVALHSDYGDTQAFAAANFGDNNDYHNQTDMGGFVYEAQGEQWFVELGFVDYGFDCGGNTYDDRLYRNKPEGHNCMIFNPVQDDTDQVISAIGKLAAEPVFGEDESYFVMDLTNGYADRLNSYKRMIYLDKNTQGFAVKDRFSLKGTNNEYYWFAHTKAEIDIDENDPTTAILTQNGKKLKVHVEGGEFTKMAAERLFPLSEASGLTGEPVNTGVTKLVVHATGKSGDCELTVTAVPLDSAGNGTLPDVSSAFFPGESDIHGLDAVTFGAAENAVADTNLAGFWNYFTALGEGFYWNSRPRNYGDNKEGFRIITAPGGPGGADDYYAKMEKDDTKLGSTATTDLRLGYRYHTNAEGHSNPAGAKIWKDGIVHISYDILLPDYNAEGVDWAPVTPVNPNPVWDTSFYMSIGSASNKAFNMIRYADWQRHFTFEGMLPGRSALVPIKVGEWAHMEWKLDYVNGTAEVKVDDYQVINDKDGSPYIGTPTLEMHPSLTDAGFEGIAFHWLGKKGSVGIDNLEIKYELTLPYIKSVDFGNGKAQGNNVLTTATNVAVEIPGIVFSADGTDNMANYVSLVDANGAAVAGTTISMASDGKTVNISMPYGTLIAGREYRIKLSGNIPYGREGHTQKGDNSTPANYIVKSSRIDTEYRFTAVNTLN